MKKVLLIVSVLVLTISLSSCRSSKSGCGLTSDATPIHKTISTEKV
jgi:hypothetical protein